jgi:hypothetical protein
MLNHALNQNSETTTTLPLPGTIHPSDSKSEALQSTRNGEIKNEKARVLNPEDCVSFLAG